MKNTRCGWMVSLALLASACGESSRTDAPPTADGELDAYCAVAGRADLETWVGDVVTLCEAGSDHDQVCTAGRVGRDGAISMLPLDPELAVRRVLPAASGRFVALLGDERLVVLDARGAIVSEIASWASDPWVSDDGNRVVWVGLADGFDEWDFGVPTVIAAQRLDASSRTILVDDEMASTPRPIPGSNDILYVSTQTGLASFYRVSPDGQPMQLSNVGLEEVGPEFVPVADRQLTWIDGALFYGVADDESPAHVWRFDLAARAGHGVGPGAWPRTVGENVLSVQPQGAERCAARYPAGGTP